MRQKLRQLTGIFLSLVMVLGLVPGMSMTAYAAESKTLAVGTVYYVGDTIMIGNGGAYLVTNDKIPKPRWIGKGNYTVPEPVYKDSANVWAFYNFLSGWSLLLGYQTANSSDKVVGIKCVGGKGHASLPYTFELAYQGSSGDDAVTITKVPAGVNAKAKKNKVTVSWKKINETKKTKAFRARIKSIQVQVSTDPGFTSIVSNIKIGKSKTKTTLKLKKKATYYVRVRYIGAHGASVWSKVKKVKTK